MKPTESIAHWIKNRALEIWLRDHWSAEFLSALGAACYCAIALTTPSTPVDRPGFSIAAELLGIRGLPHPYVFLETMGLLIGLSQIVALLSNKRWARASTMMITSWLLTAIFVGNLLNHFQPTIAFTGICLLADLYGLLKLCRGAK